MAAEEEGYGRMRVHLVARDGVGGEVKRHLNICIDRWEVSGPSKRPFLD